MASESSAWRMVRSAFMLALLAATLLGLFNVFGDRSEVMKMAEQEACAQKKCTAQQTRMMVGPFGQDYSYQVTITEPRGAPHSVDVSCKRAYVLLGEYACKRLND
jgi:hypothetical protein